LVIVAILAGHGHIDAMHAKEAAVDALIGLRKTILKLGRRPESGLRGNHGYQQTETLAGIHRTGRKRRGDPKLLQGTQRSFAIRSGEDLDGLSLGEPKALENASYGGRGSFLPGPFLTQEGSSGGVWRN
jgi:hypothetical protein